MYINEVDRSPIIFMPLNFIKWWWTSINKTIYLQRKHFNILLIYKWHALEIKRLQRSWKKPPNHCKKKNNGNIYINVVSHRKSHWSLITHKHRHMPITFYNIIKYKNSHKYENAHHHSKWVVKHIIIYMRKPNLAVLSNLLSHWSSMTHKHRHMPIAFYNIIKYKNSHKYENAHHHSKWVVKHIIIYMRKSNLAVLSNLLSHWSLMTQT